MPSLVITVCDQAHEELDPPDDWLHWSIPDPVAGRHGERRSTPRSTNCATASAACSIGAGRCRDRAIERRSPTRSRPAPARCTSTSTRRLVAEALGTGFLIVAVIGSGIMASRLSPDDVGLQLLENAAATAGALIGLILMFGAVSGAHFNPVVTLVDRLSGTLTTRDSVVLRRRPDRRRLPRRDRRQPDVRAPRRRVVDKTRSSGALWLSEVVATVGLLLVIHGCVRTGRAAAVPFAVGVWIGGAYFFTSSTSFANPAVTIARTLSDSFAGIKPSSAPMFIVMQLHRRR